MQPFYKVKKRIYTNDVIAREARLVLAESMQFSKLFLHAHIWEAMDVGSIKSLRHAYMTIFGAIVG
eukprot:4679804-Lingulodinium_polyedra.AAC.1